MAYTLSIDLQYVRLIGSSLEGFKQISDYLWNFRCPLCGDSQRNKNKKRGYIQARDGKLWMKCHNCSTALGLGKFIQELDPGMYQQYRMDILKSDDLNLDTLLRNRSVSSSKARLPTAVAQVDPASLTPLSSATADADVVAYCLRRGIPQASLQYLASSDDLPGLVNKYTDRYTHFGDDQAVLIMPFRNRRGDLVMLQTRSIAGEKQYFTYELEPEDSTWFGLDRLDVSKTVYITEGPLDSLFLPNCMAAAGVSKMGNLPKEVQPSQIVVVPDTDMFYNKQVQHVIDKLVDKGCRATVWPREFRDWKDINDMVQAGLHSQGLLAIIEANAFYGLKYKLHLTTQK